jgi:phosphoglycerate dehydrogenase-like enzyme
VADGSLHARRVLYLGPPDTLALVERELAGLDVVFALDPDEVDRALPSCAAVLDAYMKVPFTAERLAGAPDLAVIVTATTGADHIDTDAASRRGVPVLTLKGQTALLGRLTPAAEHSWLLLMACSRKLKAATGHVLEGGWDRNLFPGTMLRGTTLGLIGCGRIGRMMSRYGKAFDMNCIGYDPHVAQWPETITRAPLDAVMEEADFVSVHVHLTAETEGLVGRRELGRMKTGAVLINTSRGAILDEAALLEALESGKLGAAGLDVLAGEPETADDPLVEYARNHANLLITPHIGGFSPGALSTVLEFSCGRVRDALKA